MQAAIQGTTGVEGSEKFREFMSSGMER